MNSEAPTQQGRSSVAHPRREAGGHRATIAKPGLALSDLASGALGVAEAHKRPRGRQGPRATRPAG
jgi:hypothetical protein